MADDLSIRAQKGGGSFLAMTAPEREIASAAQDVMSGLLPIDRLHKKSVDLDEAARLKLAELGWYGLLSARLGDENGFSEVEFALLFREVGRVCGPLEILAQSLAALTAVDEDGLRESILSGQQGVALAAPDDGGLRVFGGPALDVVLLADGEQARIIRLANHASQRRPCLDPGSTMRVASLDGAKDLAASQGVHVWRLGELGAAAMLVGIAEATLELIVEYAKIRETFGRKIGGYQAVRHPCADMALRAESARCQLWYAAASLKDQRNDAGAQIDAAKHLANEAAVTNADVCIQLHGGIGITDEHNAHLYLKRALLLSQLFGSKRVLLTRLLHAALED